MSRWDFTIGTYILDEWCFKCKKGHKIPCVVVHDKHDELVYKTKMPLHKLTYNLFRLRIIKCNSLIN